MSGKQQLPAWKEQKLKEQGAELFECPSPRVGTWTVKAGPPSSAMSPGGLRRQGGGGGGGGDGGGGGKPEGLADGGGQRHPSEQFSEHESRLLASLERKLVLQRKPNRVTGLIKHHFKAAPDVINTLQLGGANAGPPSKPVRASVHVCVRAGACLCVRVCVCVCVRVCVRVVRGVGGSLLVHVPFVGAVVFSRLHVIICATASALPLSTHPPTAPRRTCVVAHTDADE